MWGASEEVEGDFLPAPSSCAAGGQHSFLRSRLSHAHRWMLLCAGQDQPVPYPPNTATKPATLQKAPWSRGTRRKGQGILPFFSLTNVLVMAFICSVAEGLVIVSIFTCCYVPFQVEFCSDNNNNLFLSLCWRKQTSFQVSLPLDYSREQRFIMLLSWPLQLAKGCHKLHQTPHFQFGSLIHPNSRQKVPLRIAGSFSDDYHYSTNITRCLMLLLKSLIFYLVPAYFSCVSLKLIIQAASHVMHLVSLFFVPLRRSGRSWWARGTQSQRCLGMLWVAEEERTDLHQVSELCPFRTYLYNNEVFLIPWNFSR